MNQPVRHALSAGKAALDSVLDNAVGDQPDAPGFVAELAAEAPSLTVAITPAPPPTCTSAPAAEAPAHPARIRAIPESHCRAINVSEGDFGTVWGAKIPVGTPWEHVISGEFWSNRAKVMHVGDEIRVMDEEGSYYAVLLVRALRQVGQSREGANRATVHVLDRYDLKPVDGGPNISLWMCSYQGPIKKWCIVRSADNIIVSDGFDSANSAEMARFELAKGVAAKT